MDVKKTKQIELHGTIELNKEQIEELRKTQLELLDVLAEYCKAHNLTFYLFGGTALGAVRHKGYIPWDDDVDICMPKEDYDYLIENFPEEGQYFVTGPEINPLCPNTFSKLFKKGTAYREYGVSYEGTPSAIFIDIFPIRSVPDSRARFASWRRWFFLDWIGWKTRPSYSHKADRKTYQKLKAAAGSEGKRKSSLFRKAHILMRLILWCLARLPIFWMTPSMARKIQASYISKKEWKDSDSIWVGGNQQSIYPKEWFEGTVYFEFEGRQMPLPGGYDKYLTKKYGDYMALPPEGQRYGHHFVLEFKA